MSVSQTYKKHKILFLCIPLVILLTVGVFFGILSFQRSREIHSLLEAGSRYLNDMEYEQAIACYEQVLSIDKKNRASNFGLAECYELQGQNEFAEAIYKKMLDMDKKDAELYPKLAELYIRSGKNELAEELLTEGMSQVNDETVKLYYEMTHPAAPTADHAPGSYDERFALTLTASSSDMIFYTLDGSDPSASSRQYTSPLVLRNGKNTIKAIAVNSAGFSSSILTAEYTINIQDVEVIIEEPLIAAYIRDTLDISYNDPIYNDDAAQITELYITGSRYLKPEEGRMLTLNSDSVLIGNQQMQIVPEHGISTLSDLKHMPFLHTLVVLCQEDVDISGIADAKRLVRVSLLHDNLETADLAALSALPDVRILSLGGNRIDNLMAVSTMSSLTSLSFWKNQVTDLSALAKLSSLVCLDFSENRVESLDVLSHLELLEELWMYENRVKLIAPLCKLEHLRVLMLRGNPITDGKEIRKIYPHLERLDVNLLELPASEKGE